MSTHRLLAALADSQPHHITELAALTERKPHQLNALWQQVPPHLRGLLRQRDGYWQLVRPLAWFGSGFQSAHFHTTLLNQTVSTNDELLAQAKSGENIHRRALIAHEQTQGRGRQGRTWQARAGECLTFSIGWTFRLPQAQLGALALVVALACRNALAAHGCAAQIKWPNDLVVGLDKLGGILIETLHRNGMTHAVIGIGINFVLPKEVEHAASFQAASKRRTAAPVLLESIFAELAAMLPEFERSGFAPFQAAYQAAHRDHGCEVCLLHEGEIRAEGTVSGIGADGALQLHTARGDMEIVSGEVSLRLPQQLRPADTPADRRYLLLDGGNSRLKWAWVENSRITDSGHAPYRDLSELQRQWQQRGSNDCRIVGSAVCGKAKQQTVVEQLGRPVEWLGSMRRALGIYNHYHLPEEHGADRWFNVLGSRRFSRHACVIVSCGTAVTIDALSADNHYLGGTIMPGFHLMKESLAQKTANLNRPDGYIYPFPTTTPNAISSGMMDAVCGSLMLMHARLSARSGTPADVVITGGGAAKVAAALPDAFTAAHSVQVVDMLVIHGLLSWVEQDKNDPTI